MSATYNWAYRPGVANKYGMTVPDSADNVKPSNWCYVAIFGDDTTGNGSRQLPYRTLTKALAVQPVGGSYFVLGSGVYREVATISPGSLNGLNFIGDGDVSIDISFIGKLISGSASNFFNIYFRGNGNTSYVSTDIYASFNYDCVFDGVSPSDNNGFYYGGMTNCIVKNWYGRLFSNSINGGGFIVNSTFYNCSNIDANNLIRFTHCLFVLCNISGTATSYLNTVYTLFYQCNFNLLDYRSGGVIYPGVPSGYTYYSAIADLQAATLSQFGQPVLNGCAIADPLFNNASIGDFTLQFASPAKNLSYFGTYVGAKSIAYPLKVSATEGNGAFDLSTAVNVTVSDDSITLINTSLDGVIETNVITNALGRQIKSIPIYGFNADRNGQYIDSIADLATTTKAAGGTLAVPASYIVESGAITYNGNSLTAGQRFTTVAGQTTFITATGGVVREILEAPQRHTIEIKLSDVQPFTTEQYNHFEPGIAPATNNVGDSRTGTILRGNGDPAYVRGSTVEFPVNSKYIKIKFTIRANNLKP